MASSFDRWEKDPFFSVAEEVQESADRMESIYRTWMHSKKDASCLWNSDELRRDLRIALGTTKWQLDEFQFAVRSSYNESFSEDSKDRHREFIIAIEDQISKIERSLQESALLESKPSSPLVRLDKGERDEFALFLSGASAVGDASSQKSHNGAVNQQNLCKGLTTDCLKSSSHFVESGSLEARDEKFHQHRRTASASADIVAWNIAITEVSCVPNSSDGQPLRPLRKAPSLSGFLSSMECASKFKLPKSCVKKWKAMDNKQEADAIPLCSSQVTEGIHAYYEKSKSCLDGCDECYAKQLYGWYGIIQRQLQRSQYQMQYGRPVQVLFWIVLFFCLIVLIGLHAI